MRRCSLRAPHAAASTAATGELPHDMAVATGPQRGETVVAVAAAAATAVASVSLALVPTVGDQAVAGIADDDAPPPGWGQWVNQPASAPGCAPGVLVMSEDGCVMSRRRGLVVTCCSASP
jgi:hypothetical protein